MKPRRRRILSALAALVLLFPYILSIAPSASAGDADRGVVTVDIVGTINPAKDDLLRAALLWAKEDNAKLLLVRLDTPGGLLNSTKSMVSLLLESEIPVVVYITPSGGGAISAGTFISLAAHFVYMAPGTSIGAAHPVLSGGGDIQGDMRTKVENYAVSFARSIAEQRGRNADWMEKAVRESVTATAQEAMELGIVDGMASDADRLLQHLEGKTLMVGGKTTVLKGLTTASRKHYSPSLRQYVLDLLCDPNIAILLGLAAMAGIFIELFNPGLFLPGIVGVVCLVLSLTAAQSLPITYGGVALLLLAVIFFAVEAFIPAFGIWGIAGIVCLILGSIYFVDQEMIWGAADLTTDFAVYFAFALLGILILFEVLMYLFDSRRTFLRKAPSLISQSGTVERIFYGAKGTHAYGKVVIDGESYDADFVRDGDEDIEVGQSIRVLEVNKDKASLKVKAE